MAGAGFGSRPIASAAFAGETPAVIFIQQTAETVSCSDSLTVTVNAALQQQQETVTVADKNVALNNVYTVIDAETISVLDSNVTRINTYTVLCSETASVLDSSSFGHFSFNSNSETVAATDVLQAIVIPLSVGSPFDYSGIAVFTDADAPVAGSLAIGGGQTTTATISETIAVADTNAGYVNVIPPPFPVIARDHDGVSRQPYPKRHKYKVPDLIAAELHRRNKLRAQIEDVMQDASYLPNLLGRSNKIVQLSPKAAKSIVPKLDQLSSSPQQISDLSQLIVSLRHRAPNDDEEAMNLILQNLWKP
jgi:hypothetical protein